MANTDAHLVVNDWRKKGAVPGELADSKFFSSLPFLKTYNVCRNPLLLQYFVVTASILYDYFLFPKNQIKFSRNL